MADRLHRCRDLIAEAGLDALMVSDSHDARYLSGFRGEDATLVVSRDVALICTDSRYWPQVHQEVAGFELVKTRGDLIPRRPRPQPRSSDRPRLSDFRGRTSATRDTCG